jgi:YHS domain-containing protein
MSRATKRGREAISILVEWSMNRRRAISLAILLTLTVSGARLEDAASPREALKGLNILIGEWKGTGQPEGSLREKQAGFWTEGMAWTWHFKGDDAWLSVAFDQGKYFKSGTLRFVPDKKLYRLTLKTSADAEQVFEGKLDDKTLTLERDGDAAGEKQRLVFKLFHDNRFVYRFEKKRAGRTSFARVYEVGATRKGVPFAAGDATPECIVSGGKGTMTVTYKGQTYHVCCSGCREAFQDNPEKYIKEFNEKKGKK